MTSSSPLANDHNVYILGAGFSRAAGLPLIADFLTRLRDSIAWLESNGRDKEAESAKLVLEFRRTAASAAYWTQLDLENIEELFSLAAAVPGDLDEHMGRAIAATLDYCAVQHGRFDTRIYMPGVDKFLSASWLQLESRQQKYYQLDTYAYLVARYLGMFANGKALGTNTFITFNYDMLVERALEELRVPYHYGLGRQSHDKDETSLASNDANAIPVLKLHGSINWGRKERGRGRGLRVFGRYRNLRDTPSHVEIVPPTWKKILEGQLENVWAEAIKALSTATRIVIVGFSMPPTDMHFKYLLAAGLTNSISLRRILFVNPSCDDLKRRASSLLRKEYLRDGRIGFRELTAYDFAGSETEMSGIGRPGLPSVGVVQEIRAAAPS